MKKVSDVAIDECVIELRAACRRPIDQSALDTLVEWLRPNFERILNRLDGGNRWAEFGERVRSQSRHMGALADFFAHHADTARVTMTELTHAVAMAGADCTIRSERMPFALHFCYYSPDVPLDMQEAERFLRSMAPSTEPTRRAG